MKTNIFPILVLGTTEIYQTQFANQDSPIMIGGNGLVSALAIAKKTYCGLVSGVGSDIYEKLLNLKIKNLNLSELKFYSGQKSFFYKSILDESGLEISGIPEFNCHRHFLDTTFESFPNCDILHCSGTDPDFYLNNIQNIDYQILSVTTIGYFLERKPDSVSKLMQKANIIFLNLEEFEILKTKINLTNKLVIVTKGSSGLGIYFKNHYYSFKTKKIQTKNTVNAGDVLAGSFLASLYTKLKNENILLKSFLNSVSADIISGLVQLSQEEVQNLLNQDSHYRIML